MFKKRNNAASVSPCDRKRGDTAKCKAHADCAMILLCLALLSLPSFAYAGTKATMASWQYSAGEVMAKTSGPVAKWRFTGGLTGVMMPAYEGSDKMEIAPGAFFDLRYRDIAFLSSGEGIGINLLRGDTYRAGVAMNYDPGRDDDSDSHIDNMGDIAFAPEANAFAQIYVMPLALTLDVKRTIGGMDGWSGNLGAYMPLSFGRKFLLFAGPSLSVADQNYMNRGFGVTESQSADSGLTEYDAKAGIKNVNFGITAIFFLTERWFISAEIAYERLLFDAADSSLTQNKNQLAGDISIAVCL